MLNRFVVVIVFVCSAQAYEFYHQIYPFNSFKVVVDTCMRSYSDVLILQDRIANNERVDEIIDLLVGRLIRLESYVDQLAVAYKYEATVTYEEIDYLIRMLEYLEVTIAQHEYQYLVHGINSITLQLKNDLKKIITANITFIRVPLRLDWCPPLINHLLQFA